MTDATMGGGRGGVGIRLFTTGGEVVKRTFSQIGDSGKRMWTEIAMGEKAANPAMRGLSAASNEAQGAVQGLAGRAGPASGALSAFGVAGVAVAAALGAAALAANQARAAMQWADDLDDAAQKINIGVEALQEWRFAMMEAGGAAEDADRAIDAFQKKLGEGLAGGRSIKWFERLGLGRDDLKAFASTDEALRAVIDRIAALGSEAERAAVSDKLGLAPMIPLIREGSGAIDDMRQRARELGIVMDEAMVKRGADAAREMEILSQVIDMQLKQAFIDLGPTLIYLMSLLAEMSVIVRDFFEAFKALEDHSSAGLKALDQRLAREQNALLSRFGNDVDRVRNDPNARGIWDRMNARRVAIGEELRDRAASAPAARPPGATLLDLPTPPRSGKSEGQREAERRAREAERALEELARMEDRQERQAPGLMFGDAGPAGKARIARELLRLDMLELAEKHESLRARLEANGALTEEVRLRLESLAETEAFLDGQRRFAIDEEERRALIAERLAAETARDQDALDLLAIDEQMARTARERLEIARRILILQQDLELKLLEASADEDGSRSADEQAAIDRLVRRQGREVELFDHQSREEMRAEFHSYGREVVQAIEDGRIGEHIAEELKARLIDMALDGLFDFLNPRGGQGGGGGGLWSSVGSFLGSLLPAAGPGRAGGGDLWRGVRHPVVETGRPELMLIGGKGQVTGAAETVQLLREAVAAAGGGANGGRMGRDTDGFEVTVLAGDGLRAEVRRVSREEARSAAATAGARSYRASVSAAPQAVADRRAYRE